MIEPIVVAVHRDVWMNWPMHGAVADARPLLRVLPHFSGEGGRDLAVETAVQGCSARKIFGSRWPSR